VVLKVVTMAELRFDVLFEPLRTGETVADVCRRYGISRDTYYRYRRRYLAEGLEGLEDQSRRPKTSPARSPPIPRSGLWRCAGIIPVGEPAGSAPN
jgi:transposase-like protein